jgi:hypothetical protein
VGAERAVRRGSICQLRRGFCGAVWTGTCRLAVCGRLGRLSVVLAGERQGAFWGLGALRRAWWKQGFRADLEDPAGLPRICDMRLVRVAFLVVVVASSAASRA